MNCKLRIILPNLFSLFLGLCLITNQVNAQIEFDSSAKIIYEIGPRGDGSARQEISLTNNFSHIYPKEYQMQISEKEIRNISAQDSQGNILSEVKRTENQTTIYLKFNDQNVGKDKTLNFFINYDLPGMAVKRGQIWEMAIPRLANLDELTDLELDLKVPTNFGALSYSSTNPASEEIINNQLLLTFTQNQFGQNPILLAFGEFQTFNFDLDFSLTNNKARKVFQTIPIPPDTSYQSVFLTEIKPKPIKIYTDNDFNWLALYQLNPNEKININVKGQARIFSNPENEKFSKLYENKSLNAYLKNDLYWEVNSPIIQDLTNYLSTPKQVYDFVVDHLEYDYQGIKESKRLGAIEAYRQEKGVCTEFSDLFVTLARAINVPARELQGFAFTENKELFTLAAESDVLHSWVEYWDSDKKIWLPADPTWAKTTQGIDFINHFDLGHFVFVTHGQSSTEPIPPGFYKTSNSQNKSNKVEFADKLIKPPETNISAELNYNNEKLELKIKNNSLSPVYQTKAVFYGWNKGNQEEISIDLLPPLGEEVIKVKNPSFWKKVFSIPTYEITINQELFSLQYPGKTLNLIGFFANLWPR